jgi:hypothetical protein
VINKLLSHFKIFTDDMEIILTESQLQKLLLEQGNDQIKNEFDESKKFIKSVMSYVKKQHKLDFSFAATWGAALGGFARPVADYLHGIDPTLSEGNIKLIVFGIILTFFSTNAEKLGRVLEIIKQNGLITYFDMALRKSYDLRDAFIDFLNSLNLTFSKVSNMLAYAFLIPVVPLLENVFGSGLSDSQEQLFMDGILHYSGVMTGSAILYEVIKRMIKRFKSSRSS